MHSLRLLPLIALSLLVGLAGCQPTPQIKTQEAPRLPLQRCIGAIVLPRGEASSTIWLFKVIGPELDVDYFKPAFDKYVLENIKFSDNEQLFANLPKGWTEKKIDKQPIANIQADKFEIVVTRRTMRRPRPDDGRSVAVSHKKDEESFMLYNVEQRVERWRRELGLAGGLADYFYEPHPLEGKCMAFLVNMTGPKHVDIPVTDFVFDLPAGWEETPPRLMGDIQIPLAMRIVEKNQRANFSLSRSGGSILANVNRWRDQTSLDPEPDETKLNLRDIAVGELKGKYVDLSQPDPSKRKLKTASGMDTVERILGVIVNYNGDQWFFKLSGPADLVGRNKDKFETFVERFVFTE